MPRKGSIMKIIHCADLHLDSKITANLSKEKASERRHEILLTFKKMIDYAAKNDIRALIIAGDLFDTKHISETTREVVNGCFSDHPKIEFYYLKGNHDRDDFFEGLDSIPDNLHLFGNTWETYHIPGDGRRDIVITGVEFDADNSGSVYSSLALKEEDFNIVVLHGQTQEYRSADKAEVIRLPDLKGKNIDYLALGHIHQYKCEKLDARGKYCYSGCLEGRGFDECGEHGFVLLEIDEPAGNFTDRFIPFAKRNLHEEKVDISECENTYQINNTIQTQLKERQYPAEDMIKIVLVGQVDLNCEKNLSLLNTSLSESTYHYVKVVDQTERKVNYDEYMHDVSLKGEFIRAVSQEDLPDKEKARIIRIGLDALSGGEL